MASGYSGTTRPQGCSGCLIEAIERHDEHRLRNLLSATNVKYSDDYWVPRKTVFRFMAPFPNSIRRFPMLTTYSQNSEHQCAHPVVEETPVPGKPANIAMSVVLVSMLHTSAQFNAFQIVVESRKFDMNDSLIFHLWHIFDWALIIVDPAVMALLLDKGTESTDIDDPPNYFILLKTLKHFCSKHLERSLQAIEVHNALDWIIHRERGNLSFLSSLWYSGSLLGGFSGSKLVWLLARLKALCRMSLCFDTRDCLFNTLYCSFRPLRKLTNNCLRKNKSVLLALTDMFCIISNADNEYYVGQLILCGLIGVCNDYPDDSPVLSELIYELLNNKMESLRWESLFRIARQLLALALFRQRGAVLFLFYLKIFFKISEEEERKFPVDNVLSLRTEFFRNPLSLLQLSRAAIRRLFAMNDFERRIKTLPLPPLLLEYVWRANEMLKDVAPVEGSDPQPF